MDGACSLEPKGCLTLSWLYIASSILSLHRITSHTLSYASLNYWWEIVVFLDIVTICFQFVMDCVSCTIPVDDYSNYIMYVH